MTKSFQGVEKTSQILVNFTKMKAGSEQSDTDEHETIDRPVRKKRRTQRYCDSDSDEGIMFWKAMRRKAWIHYEESDSSSESAMGLLDLQNDRFSASKVNYADERLPVGVVRGCSSCETCQKVMARWHPSMGRRPHLEDAPVYFPDEEEFSDPIRFIASIRDKAESYGICRIVPPRSWRPPCPLKDRHKLQETFPTRVQQVHKLQVRESGGQASQQTMKEGVTSKERPSRMGGIYQVNSEVERPNNEFGFEPGPDFTLESFEKYANEFKEHYFRSENSFEMKCSMSNLACLEPTPEMIEGEYWRIVEEPTEQIEVVYGADIETYSFGSGFPKAKAGTKTEDLTEYEKSGWNLNNIARGKGSVLAFEQADISGVVVPWLYVGMCFSSFCWHVEDHHFYSVNYMHWGSPKIWYGVPGAAAMKLEDSMRKHLPSLFKEQPDLLHKLVTQLSPSVLTKEGVPIYRAVQRPGDFVITFPRAYHAGFNCGFNCAEAVNVAPIDWLPHGQGAVELYRELHRKASVSHDKLLLSVALNAVRELCHIQTASKENEALAAKCLKFLQSTCLKQVEKTRNQSDSNCIWQEFRGRLGMLANALQARLKMERARRAGLTGLRTMRRMDTAFDASEERECSNCRYDLHLSAVGCDCSPERYLCLEHAASLCTCSLDQKFLLFRHELSELDTLLAVLEEQPGALCNWVKQQEMPFCESELELPFHQFDSHSLVQAESLEVFSDPQTHKMTHVTPSFTDRMALNLEGRPTRSLESLETFVMDKTSARKRYKQDEHSESNVSVQSCEFLSVPIQIEKKFSCDFNLTELEQDKCDKENFPFQNSKQFSNPVASVKIESPDATPKITQSFQFNNAGLVDHRRKQNSPSDLITLSDDDVKDVDTKASDSCLETSFCLLKASNSVSVKKVPSSSAGLLLENFLQSEPVQRSEKYASSDKGGYNSDLSLSREHALRLCQESAMINPFTMVGDACHQFPATHIRNEWQDVKLRHEVQGHILPKTNGPRIAKVLHSKRVNPRVELIDAGRLILKENWHDKHMIYPAGFKSRTRFFNFCNLPERCYYISEVLDIGKDRPYFKVTLEGGASEEFVSSSANASWQEIQNRLTLAIRKQQIPGRTDIANTYFPEKLSGFDMFGFNSPSVVQAVEALDSDHVCVDYWAAKQMKRPLQSRHSSHDLDGVHMFESNAATPNGRALPEKTAVHVASPQSEHAGGQVVDQRTRIRNPLDGRKNYNILRNFFKKGTSSELWTLLSVLRSDGGGQDWKEGCQALTDEFELMLESQR